VLIRAQIFRTKTDIRDCYEVKPNQASLSVSNGSDGETDQLHLEEMAEQSRFVDQIKSLPRIARSFAENLTFI
jgi:hypothetical protein